MLKKKVPAPKGIFTVAVKKKGELDYHTSYTFNNRFTGYGLGTIYGTPNGRAFMLTGNTSCPLRYCAVGSGTSPITRNQVTLGAQVGSRYDIPTFGNRNYISEVVEIGGVKYASFQSTWVFDLGGIVGNISEVGLYRTPSGDTLMCGTLIKDEEGLPVTVTVTSDDELHVTYRLLLMVPDETPLGSFGNSTIYSDPTPIAVTVGGVEYTGRIHLPFHYSFSGGSYLTIYAGTSSRTTNQCDIYNSGALSSTYNHGGNVSVTAVRTDFTDKYQMDVSIIVQPEAGAMDVYGILCNRAYSGLNWFTDLLVFDDPIPKSATQTLNINYSYTVDWSEEE